MAPSAPSAGGDATWTAPAGGRRLGSGPTHSGGSGMAQIVIIGAGLNGLLASMMLARDGNAVTVLERDPSPPPASPEEAWQTWERRGVNQFRLPHFLACRWRQVVE